MPRLSAHINLPVKERPIDIVFNKIKSFNIQIEKKTVAVNYQRKTVCYLKKN